MDDIDQRIDHDAAAYIDARRALDEARDRLHATILDATAAGKGPSELARRTTLTREYVARLRDKASS